MFLNHIISWGMVAMLSSLTMTTGSVDRNSTLSQNNNPASVEEATEGCAAEFNTDDLIRFKYIGTLYDKTSVELESNWERDLAETRSCDNFNVYPCVIYVDPTYVNSSDELDPSIQLQASSGTSSSVFHIVGSNDPNMLKLNNTVASLD